MVRKDILVMLIELVVGLVLVFFLISNKLGDKTWIVWIALIVFIIYKIKKEGLDFY